VMSRSRARTGGYRHDAGELMQFRCLFATGLNA
jgi:hypothetical protein